MTIEILIVLSVVIATILFAVPLAGTAAAGNPRDYVGAVYTMTNDDTRNEVIMSHRTAHGLLVPGGAFSTGGPGSGNGLGDQGALALSAGNRWLFVVSAGSNEVSVFRVEPSGLTLVDRQPSGGSRPVSVTVDRNFLYVLNAGGAVGGTDTITALLVGPDGTLAPLAGSTRFLSAASTALKDH